MKKKCQKFTWKIKKILVETNIGQMWFQLIFKIFHCHCRQIKQFIRYFIGTFQLRCCPNVMNNGIDLIQNLSEKFCLKNVKKKCKK